MFKDCIKKALVETIKEDNFEPDKEQWLLQKLITDKYLNSLKSFLLNGVVAFALLIIMVLMAIPQFLFNMFIPKFIWIIFGVLLGCYVSGTLIDIHYLKKTTISVVDQYNKRQKEIIKDK